MTDIHVHIGQFNDKYYDSHAVFNAIEQSATEFGIDCVRYSSTSSCRYDVELFRIEEEIAVAQSYKSSIIKTQPYLWFTPRYATQGISVKSAMQAFDYCGFKLHPFAHNWDFENASHRKSLDEIFSYSAENRKSILIHCGVGEIQSPTRFECFIKNHPNAPVILAHSQPYNKTIKMMSKYPNVKCDTAFLSPQEIKRLILEVNKNNLAESRILFGSDFPITHYYNEENISLTKQYPKDCKQIHILRS